MSVTTAKTYLQRNKFWLALITTAFSLGGVAASFAVDRVDHNKASKEILELTKMHTEDVKTLLEIIHKDAGTTKTIMEKILNVNTTACINGAKTEAGRTNCVK